jgi:DNA-binding transcriptional LysR family regulator
MSEAAKFMGLTQSATTQQIKSLENDLNMILFQREFRPLALTVEGQDLYKSIAPIINNFESVIEEFLQKEEDRKKKEINIAAHHVSISHLMPEVIREFKNIDPDSKIIFRNIPPAEAIERLKNREIDLAFYPFYELDSDINYIEIIRYRPILIMRKSHPFADREINSLNDLKKYDLIRIDKNLITLPFFEDAVSNYNVKGSIEFENGNWDMLINLVKKNDFVAVVSDICIKSEDDLLIKDLTKFFPHMKYSVAHLGEYQTKKNNLKNFIDIMKGFDDKHKN